MTLVTEIALGLGIGAALAGAWNCIFAGHEIAEGWAYGILFIAIPFLVLAVFSFVAICLFAAGVTLGWHNYLSVIWN